MNINSEYEHITHVLESIEAKVDNLTSDVDNIKNTFKEIDDVSKELKVDVNKISDATSDFLQACVELKGYLSFVEREYFPKLKIDLLNTVERSSNDIITSLTNTANDNHDDLQDRITQLSKDNGERLEKILEILNKVGPGDYKK